jgi:hypothetical protein
MGALLESGMVGNIGLKHLRVIKEDTIKKWDELGFLEGLEGHQRDNIAQLYENQASHLINEAAVTDSSGSFETVVFPIIRRVFSKLLANDIVSVQAMNLPIGKLFYFIPLIQERDREVNGSTRHYSPYVGPNGQATANNDSTAGYPAGQRNLYDRFYEENDNNDQGLFDYSKGAFETVSVTGTTLVSFNSGVEQTVTITTGDTVSNVILKVTGFTASGDGAGKLIGPNGHEIDTEEFLSSLQVSSDLINGGNFLNFNLVTQKYGRGIVDYGSRNTGRTGRWFDVCDANGVIYINVDVESYSSVSGFSPLTETALEGTDFVVTYRNYESLEFEEEIGEVSFDLQSVTVSVTDRKLRASWSPELAQDVSAFHNIDAEAELTALLSEQIAAEVDREILRDLRKGAAWTDKWDYNEWKYGGSEGATLQGYTQKDWNQTLVTVINQMSAQIHKTTLRGGANWIVVSSEVSAIFDDLEYFHVSNAHPEQDQYNMGIEKVGSLAGRYQVYRDPYFPPNKILIGHKGKSLLDAGYIYAPYVPLQLTPTMYNPFNMTPIKGIMTRYAKKMVNNRYFGVIDVRGLKVYGTGTLR